MTSFRSPWLRVLAAIVAGFATDAAGQTMFTVPSAATPTIQSAIAASMDGDTVLVAAGTYFENLDFLGKEILVEGAGPGLSVIDAGGVGAAVVFANGEGQAAILRGFTLTNGVGHTFAIGTFGSMLTVGGAVAVLGNQTSAGMPHPRLENCTITGSSGQAGAAVGIFLQAECTLEDCLVTGNTSPTHAIAGNTGAFVNLFGCEVVGNACGGIHVDVLYAADCVIANNVAVSPSGSGSGGGIRAPSGGLHLRRCVIRGNVAGTTAGGIYLSGGSAATYEIEDCLITGNSAPFVGAILSGVSLRMRNTTVSGNMSGIGYGCVLSSSAGLPTSEIDNCIFWNNGPNEVAQGRNPGLVVVSDSIIQGWSGLGGSSTLSFANVSGSDPMFRDAAAGDYRLSFGSPAIDAGDASNLWTSAPAGTPPMDLEGELRVAGGGVDIGADELVDIAIHPAARSRFVDGAGEELRTLRILGDDGGVDRRVLAQVGQPLSFEMLPPLGTAGAGFAVFGVIGVPGYLDPVSLPFGLGEMAIVPCPLAPWLSGLLFTLTDNGFGLPCPQLIASYPAPWSSGLLPGIPVPLEVSFQGAMSDGQGGIELTNLVILKVD